jgi:hypothetical protein
VFLSCQTHRLFDSGGVREEEHWEITSKEVVAPLPHSKKNQIKNHQAGTPIEASRFTEQEKQITTRSTRLQ